MIFDRWVLVAADLISEYGLNVYDREQLRRVSWPALTAMLGGLFAGETRVARWYEQEHGEAGRGVGASGARSRRASRQAAY